MEKDGPEQRPPMKPDWREALMPALFAPIYDWPRYHPELYREGKKE